MTTRLLCLFAVLVCGTLGALVDPSPAYACDCSARSTYRALGNADAVFRGSVTKLDETGGGTRQQVAIRFQVTEVYKGTVYADQVVVSAAREASCGLEPDLGSQWIIFATLETRGRGDRAISRLSTTWCSGNLSDARAPAVLGRPRAPLAGPSDREERSIRTDQRLTRVVLITGIAILGAGVLVVVGLLLVWRPGRNRC